MSVFPCMALLAGVVGTGAASYCSPPHLLLYSESQFFAQLGRKDLWPSRAVIPNWQWRAR